MYQCSSIYTFFVVTFHLSIFNLNPALVVLKFSFSSSSRLH